MTHQRKDSIVLAAALVLIATPRMANAYVDPGSGTMLWQLGAAALIGALFYVRRAALWIRKRLGLGQRERDDSCPPPSAE